MMQTTTLFYRLQEASLNLNFIQKGFLKFNDKGELDRAGTIDPDKLKVLVKIFKNLQEAPIVHLSPTVITTFLTTLGQYNAPANSKISKKVKEIISFVNQIAKNTLKCNQENLSKSIDTILCTPELSDDHANILLQFSKSLLYKRFEARTLYHYIATSQKINSLQKLCCNADFSFDSKFWRIVVFTPPLSEAEEQLMFIRIHFAMNFASTEPLELLVKDIAKEKFYTKNPTYKKYLQDVLYAFAVIMLEKSWKLPKEEQFISDFSNEYEKLEKTHFRLFLKEFCYESPEYTCLTKERENLLSFMKNEDLDKHAKTLKKHSIDSAQLNAEWDHLYSLVYQRLKQFNKKLPTFTPEEFIAAKNFISESHLRVSLLDQVKELEQQFFSIKKEVQQPSLVSLSSPAKKLPENSQAAVPAVKESEIIVEDKSTTPAIEVKSIASFKCSLDKTILNQNSPFPMHDRVTEWFINPSSEDRKCQIVHNFALVINQIMWKSGLRYQHTEGQKKQAALAMLCKVNHPLFNSNLMTITMTFNPSKESLFGDCYHRALAQKEQQEEDVKEYVKLAKYQKDYPILPHKQVDLTNLEGLKNVIYPDGSYVESIDGQIVAVKDPKNGCTIQLFVVV